MYGPNFSLLEKTKSDGRPSAHSREGLQKVEKVYPKK